MRTLSLEHPERVVRATEHIEEMAQFIRALEQKGFAYRTEDGSYYFSIAKFPQYGVVPTGGNVHEMFNGTPWSATPPNSGKASMESTAGYTEGAIIWTPRSMS